MQSGQVLDSDSLDENEGASGNVGDKNELPPAFRDEPPPPVSLDKEAVCNANRVWEDLVLNNNNS